MESVKDTPKVDKRSKEYRDSLSKETPAETETITDTPKTTEEIKVADTKDLQEIKKDEYTAQVIIDHDAAADPFVLTQKDPEFAYRFLLNTKESLSIKTGNLLAQKGGWQVCPRTHLERIGIKAEQIDSEGHYIQGSNILAFMPKELFAKKEEFKRKQASVPVDAVQRMIKKGDPNKGGQEIHESMRGIQTQKALGM